MEIICTYSMYFQLSLTKKWQKTYRYHYIIYHLRIFLQLSHQTLGYLNGNKHFLTEKVLWQINARFGIKVWNLGPILVKKVLQNKVNKKCHWYKLCSWFFILQWKKIWKDSDDFRQRKLTFQIQSQALICQRFFELRKCLFPFS